MPARTTVEGEIEDLIIESIFASTSRKKKLPRQCCRRIYFKCFWISRKNFNSIVNWIKIFEKWKSIRARNRSKRNKSKRALSRLNRFQPLFDLCQGKAREKQHRENLSGNFFFCFIIDFAFNSSELNDFHWIIIANWRRVQRPQQACLALDETLFASIIGLDTQQVPYDTRYVNLELKVVIKRVIIGRTFNCSWMKVPKIVGF